PNVCLTDATIVVMDSRLVRGTVTITTEAGSADPPPAPLRAIPSTMTLTCSANTGTILIAGGADPTAQVTPSTADARLVVNAPSPRQVTVDFQTGGFTTDVPPN